MDISAKSNKTILLFKGLISALIITNCVGIFFAFTYRVKNLALEKRITQTEADLNTSRDEKTRLQTLVKADQLDLDKARKDAANATNQLANIRDSVGAFAQQAATCEVVKKKLGLTS